MGIGVEIERVYVKAVGGKIPHHTPPNLQYVLVIEARADKALATGAPGNMPEAYHLWFTAHDQMTGAVAPAPMSQGPLLEQFSNTNGWVDIGTELEAVKEYQIGGFLPIPAVEKDHMFKYNVVLTLTDGTDADGAEGETFILT